MAGCFCERRDDFVWHGIRGAAPNECWEAVRRLLRALQRAGINHQRRVIFAPVFHRFLHKFHVEVQEREREKS